MGCWVAVVWLAGIGAPSTAALQPQNELAAFDAYAESAERTESLAQYTPLRVDRGTSPVQRAPVSPKPGRVPADAGLESEDVAVEPADASSIPEDVDVEPDASESSEDREVQPASGGRSYAEADTVTSGLYSSREEAEAAALAEVARRAGHYLATQWGLSEDWPVPPSLVDKYAVIDRQVTDEQRDFGEVSATMYRARLRYQFSQPLVDAAFRHWRAEVGPQRADHVAVLFAAIALLFTVTHIVARRTENASHTAPA